MMKKEEELIPYDTSSLPTGPYLVFAPHPDDETFGMGGTIALASCAGIEVSVVIVTDGSVDGDVNKRISETRKAAAVLGVNKLDFWGIKDREVYKSDAFKKKILRVLKTLQPQTIFVPSPFEYHPDHRATTALVWQSLQMNDYKAQIWMYEITRQGEANCLIDITPVIKRKKKAIMCYKSQLRLRAYKDIVLSLNRARSYTLKENVKYSEAFYKISSKDSIYSIQEKIRDYLYGIY